MAGQPFALADMWDFAAVQRTESVQAKPQVFLSVLYFAKSKYEKSGDLGHRFSLEISLCGCDNRRHYRVAEMVVLLTG